MLEMVVETIAELAGDGFAGEGGPLAFEISERAAEGGDDDDQECGDEQAASQGIAGDRADGADEDFLSCADGLLLDQSIDRSADNQRREIEQSDADGHRDRAQEVATALAGSEVPQGLEFVLRLSHFEPRKHPHRQRIATGLLARRLSVVHFSRLHLYRLLSVPGWPVVCMMGWSRRGSACI